MYHIYYIFHFIPFRIFPHYDKAQIFSNELYNLFILSAPYLLILLLLTTI